MKETKGFSQFLGGDCLFKVIRVNISYSTHFLSHGIKRSEHHQPDEVLLGVKCLSASVLSDQVPTAVLFNPIGIKFALTIYFKTMQGDNNYLFNR